MLDKIFAAAVSSPARPAQAYFWPLRSTSGIHIDEDTALTYSAVFGAVKVITETVALLPWRPFRETDNRRELLAGTDLDVVLHRRPNQELTAFQWREFLIACALLYGNGYAEIERNSSGTVKGLHQIHPQRVEIKRSERGALFYRVRNDTGGSNDLLPRQMFHLRGPTKDGIVGRSVLSLARESWGLGIAAEQFASGFFGNGAVPSLVLTQGKESPVKLSNESANNLLESFERRHKGARGAGKTALLEPGFDIKSIGVPQKDAQFIEVRKFSVTDVARWFRVPPHKIGDLEKATFSNIEEQERNFVNDAVMPWSIRLEQEANAKLVTEPGVITKLDARALLRGNNKDRAEFYRNMRDLGALSINEIRALEDMDPIDGGDLRLVPLNMVSIERAGQAGGTDPAAALRGVLLEAHARMLGKEEKAVERARASGKDLVAWAQEFYARHVEQLRDALMPGAGAVGAVRGLDVELIAGIVEQHARLYCETAMTAAVQGGDLTAGPARIAAQTDRLIGLLIGATHAIPG